jgi:hypothetical protein
MIARSRNRGAPPAAIPAAALSLPPEHSGIGPVSAHLVRLEPGFYAFRLVHATGWSRAGLGFAVPVVQVSELSGPDATLEIRDPEGGSRSWLGGSHQVLFVKAPGGGTALITGYLARDPEASPLRLDVFRIGGDARSLPAQDAGAPLLTLDLSGDDSGPWPRPVTVHVLTHIRGRGDVRFFDAPWAGRLGPGQWIEAFTLAPRPSHIAMALEYKGLMAGGNETPWLPCGTPCGTSGRSIPLLGFAIRQRASPGDMRYDCEYSGYFASGATAGPARNGAPCRSPAESDPLEGLQIAITRRPARTSARTA